MAKNIESTQAFETLINQPDSVVVVDMENRIMAVNNATNRLLGYSEDDLIGKEFNILSQLLKNYYPTNPMLNLC